jgi:hypothetical protein
MTLYLLGISRSEDLARLLCSLASPRSVVRNREPAEACPEPRQDAISWVVEEALSAATVQPLPPRSQLRHGALLTAIHRCIDILPARLGIVLPGEDALREFLHRQQEKLLQELERLRGTSEIGLRIEFPPSSAAPCPALANHRRDAALSPTGYLAVRRREFARIDRLDRQAQLASEFYLRGLRGLYQDRRRLAAPPGVLRLAFLVSRKRCEPFRERVRMLGAACASERCTRLGPWPPYSFV